jgi:hypothetical protein
MLNQVQHDGLGGNTQFNVVSHPATVSVQIFSQVSISDFLKGSLSVLYNFFYLV